MANDIVYPDNWAPPIIRSDTLCVPITGLYKYVGDEGGNTPDKLKNPTLEGVAFRRISIKYTLDAKVEIAHRPEAGIIDVAVIPGSDMERKSVTYSEKVSCEDGWTTIEYSVKGYADGAATISHEKKYIAKSSDGALVIRDQYQTESKHLFIFKSRRTGDVWYRFPSTR